MLQRALPGVAGRGRRQLAPRGMPGWADRRIVRGAARHLRCPASSSAPEPAKEDEEEAVDAASRSTARNSSLAVRPGLSDFDSAVGGGAAATRGLGGLPWLCAPEVTSVAPAAFRERAKKGGSEGGHIRSLGWGSSRGVAGPSRRGWRGCPFNPSPPTGYIRASRALRVTLENRPIPPGAG